MDSSRAQEDEVMQIADTTPQKAILTPAKSVRTQDQVSSAKSFEPPARALVAADDQVEGKKQPRWRSKKTGASTADAESAEGLSGSTAAKRVREHEQEHAGVQRPNGVE